MYLYTLRDRQIEALKDSKITESEFSVCFNTADTHSIDIDGFLDDTIFIKALRTYQQIKELEKWIQKELVKLNLPIVRLKIEQVYRSYETYKRLLREGYSPSKSSQHHRAEAGDIHYEYYDTLSQSWRELRLNSDGDVYMGMGFKPEDGVNSKLQNIKELLEFIFRLLVMYKNSVLEIVQLRFYDWGTHMGFKYDVYVTNSISTGTENFIIERR